MNPTDAALAVLEEHQALYLDPAEDPFMACICTGHDGPVAWPCPAAVVAQAWIDEELQSRADAARADWLREEDNGG